MLMKQNINNDARGKGGGGTPIYWLSIRVCAAGKGMVFNPFSLV